MAVIDLLSYVGVNEGTDQVFHNGDRVIVDIDSTSDVNAIQIESELFISQTKIAVFENLIIVGRLEMILVFDYALPVNLLNYTPMKFHDKDYYRDFLKMAGSFVGSWLGSVDNMSKLANPYQVGIDYINHLAKNVGFDFREGDTAIDKRAFLINLMGLYKRKGTYKSLQFLATAFNIDINIYDLYTDDYVTFVRQDWFVGDGLGDNPEGLDSTYYKSPHFQLAFILSTVNGTSPNQYLWKDSLFLDEFIAYQDQITPIHTVPNYVLELYPEGDISGYSKLVDGNIQTISMNLLDPIRQHFDEYDYDYVMDGDNNVMDGNNYVVVDTGEDLIRHFDDGLVFDDQQNDYENITIWKIGTGNKNVDLSESGFIYELETEVKSGEVDSIAVFDDRIEYTIIVSSVTDIDGISELCLYNQVSPYYLNIMSVFPDIDLASDKKLIIKVTLYLI